MLIQFHQFFIYLLKHVRYDYQDPISKKPRIPGGAIYSVSFCCFLRKTAHAPQNGIIHYRTKPSFCFDM